jgi:1,4-dihydroxy-2-naphthoate octaprenyltransferase
MSTDDFLDGLKTDWQSRQVDLSSLEAEVAQGDKLLRRQKTVRLFSMVMYLVLTLAFAYFAVTLSSPLFHLGAVAFLVAMLLTVGEFLFLRRVTGADFMDDADTLLKKAERQAQSAVMLSQGALAAAILLGVCALIATVFGITGRADPLVAAVLAVVWAASGAMAWLGQLRQRMQAEAELEQFQSLRAELETEG